jgi:sulfate adenylyltransferase subunit 2
VPLYFAGKRPVVERDGMLIMVDDERIPLNGRASAGDALDPLPHAGLLPADRRGRERGGDPAEVIQEMLLTTTSERQGRAIDHDQAASMEKKKQEGYF